MSETLEDSDFDRLLAGTVDEAWARCLPVWRLRGRIEDKPRNLHLPSYHVSKEKWLGRAFAEAFLTDWPFVAGKLPSQDPVEAACAHDALKYMEGEGGPMSEQLWGIAIPIPDWVRAEMADLARRYAEFRGYTLGELFRFESEQGF